MSFALKLHGSSILAMMNWLEFLKSCLSVQLSLILNSWQSSCLCLLLSVERWACITEASWCLFLWGLSFAQRYVYDLHQRNHIICSVTVSQQSFLQVQYRWISTAYKLRMILDYKNHTEEYSIETIFGLQSLEHFFICPLPPPLPAPALWYFFVWIYNLLIPCSIYRLFTVLGYDR